ncbi:MAG: ATP-dependent Clp protease ATP-binding subunit, partial [Oscillospiraceae bacterium]|nr:ATP-dependent Clp protease ATP-binding subunit [Oscillospiraceae bacterium]
MQPPICSRCKKNVAVVFIRKIENGKTVNEGLCLKCAKELNIKPVEDLMQNMGITDEDIDGLSAEMTEALNGVEEIPVSDDPNDESGKTATFPFLNKLFGGNPAPNPEPPRPNREPPKNEGAPPRGQKRKFLESYCQDLTGKAKAGKLDRIVGRETELERVIQILNRRQKNNPCLIG